MRRCWTGRRWLRLGPLAVGFGPDEPVERVYWRGQLVWVNARAVYLHRLEALAYESRKRARRAYRDYYVTEQGETDGAPGGRL